MHIPHLRRWAEKNLALDDAHWVAERLLLGILERAVNSDQVRSIPVNSDQVRSGSIRSDQVRSGWLGLGGALRPFRF
jgi:hypothetical protein